MSRFSFLKSAPSIVSSRYYGGMSQIIPQIFDLQSFEAASHQNGSVYWYARELMKMLGYQSWASFEKVILKAMASCGRINVDPTEVFQRKDTIEDGNFVKNYRLSRFACLLITMNADSGKPQVAQAKTILAAIADHLIAERIQESDLGRLETREDLKAAEGVMTQAAHLAGLESSQFGIFKDAGFRGMYNMSLNRLKAHKGIDGNKTLYDFMGLEELAGNLFRVTQTSARIRSERVGGLNALANTAKEVGQEVREMMIRNSGGIPPEALPVAEDVRKVRSRIRQAHKAMNKLDKPAKNKRPRKLKTDTPPSSQS